MTQLCRIVERLPSAKPTHPAAKRPALPGSALRLPWLVSLTAALLGCASSHTAAPPGASDGPLPVTPPAGRHASTLAKWDELPAAKSWPVLLDKAPSRGHGASSWTFELRGNPTAQDAFNSLLPGATMPAGSLLVAVHAERTSGTEIGYFVMRKQAPGYFPEGGDWEYLVVDSGGTIQARGKLGSCARCHAEAPADWVFPRPVEQFEGDH